MIKNLMSILILTLCLSHCTNIDFRPFPTSEYSPITTPATVLKWIITKGDNKKVVDRE